MNALLLQRQWQISWGLQHLVSQKNDLSNADTIPIPLSTAEIFSTQFPSPPPFQQVPRIQGTPEAPVWSGQWSHLRNTPYGYQSTKMTPNTNITGF